MLTGRLLLFSLLTSLGSFAAHASEEFEVVIGRVVAYRHISPLLCLNSKMHWSIIIHVQNPKEPGPEFIQADLPCGQSLHHISFGHTLQSFCLVREKTSDTTLDQFVSITSFDPHTGNEHKQDIPVWSRIPGTEKEQLPFGQMIRGYRYLDITLKPTL